MTLPDWVAAEIRKRNIEDFLTTKRSGTVDEKQLRIRCLELAASCGCTPYAAVSHAREFYDFIQGTNDAEIISAARALAEKVK